MNSEGTIEATLEIISAKYPSRLFVNEQNGAVIQAGFTKNRNLYASVMAHGELLSAEFQPIHFDGPVRIVLVISWSNRSLNSYINGIALKGADAPPRVFDSTEKVREKPKIIRPSHEIECTEPEWLFLETLFDLQDKLEVSSPYSLLRAAGLIRQLIADSGNLLDIVNREYRYSFSFQLPPEDKNPLRTISGVAPEVSVWRLWFDFESAPRISVNLPNLLKYTVAHKSGHPISVKEFIDFAANSKGGVHWDSVKSVPSRDRIKAISRFGRLTNTEASVRDLGFVLLEGLLPFVKLIQSARSVKKYGQSWSSYSLPGKVGK